METIKNINERAKEWSKHIVETTPYDVINGKVCVFAEDRDIADVAEESYIAGAKDQQDIDRALWLKLKSSWEEEAQINHNDKSNYKQGYHDAIEKACEWFSDYLFEIGYPDGWKRDSENIISGERRFRKAMKKELWKR